MADWQAFQGTWEPWKNDTIRREIVVFGIKKYIRYIGKVCITGGKFDSVPGKFCTFSNRDGRALAHNVVKILNILP